MPNRPEFPGENKLTIVFLELGPPGVTATYNPKEVSMEKSIPWNKHKTSKGDNPILEFTDSEPSSLSFEMFFDTYESGRNVYTEHIAILEKGTLIMGGSNEEKKRPPTCLVTWGKGFPKFVGVIEQLSVKYTMFFADGTPCRATASVKLKQAAKTTKAADKDVPIDDVSGGGEPQSSDRRTDQRPSRGGG
jgi:hypothetical protein